MVPNIHQGLFPPKIFFRFFGPHKFISGGNLMNGIVLSRDGFMPSFYRQLNSRKFKEI
jgi:hypothetical protein